MNYRQSYYLLHKEAIKEKTKNRQVKQKELRNVPLAKSQFCPDCQRKYIIDIEEISHQRGCRYSKQQNHAIKDKAFILKGNFQISI